MKYVTIKKGESLLPGILTKDEKHIITFTSVFKNKYPTLIDFIEKRTEEDVKTLMHASTHEEGININEVKLLSPIPSAKHDIICVGVNYLDHLEEAKEHSLDGKTIPTEDTVYFGKRASIITGPNEEIDGHLNLDTWLDYEVELAVIIGKKIDSSVKYEDLGNYVFGYSAFNDISARTLQQKKNQWYMGKSLDSFSVMGPVIVSSDEIEFNEALSLESRVNGEVRQHSNTRLMRMKVSDIIFELSRGITLDPGDIIATGTPAGVGQGFNPPKFLKNGDIVEVEVEKIGVIRNTIK